ncbi:MAG: hypothetical protein O6940_13015 [Ignavibacteria bacterium]|nr:hypothetical protein [Ignavibacteria bacterium]
MKNNYVLITAAKNEAAFIESTIKSVVHQTLQPKNWIGWPDSKRFALVLTHDAELRCGHDKCRQLLQI